MPHRTSRVLADYNFVVNALLALHRCGTYHCATHAIRGHQLTLGWQSIAWPQLAALDLRRQIPQYLRREAVARSPFDTKVRRRCIAHAIEFYRTA